jgi:hypothetical protein
MTDTVTTYDPNLSGRIYVRPNVRTSALLARTDVLRSLARRGPYGARQGHALDPYSGDRVMPLSTLPPVRPTR